MTWQPIEAGAAGDRLTLTALKWEGNPTAFRLSTVLYRALGRPEAVRIEVNQRTGAIKLSPTTRDEPGSRAVHPNRRLISSSYLHTFLDPDHGQKYEFEVAYGGEKVAALYTPERSDTPDE